MSIGILGDVLKCGAIFRGAEKAVLLVYANYANDRDEAYPSTPEAAWTSGVSERSIKRVLLDLEDLGLLELLRNGGGRTTAKYRLNAELLHRLAVELERVKQAARQDGRDRHRAMRARAGELRAWLEEEMHHDPVRGPRWRKRRKQAAGYRTAHRERRAVSVDDAGRGDVESPLNDTRGDTMSPLDESKKICDGAGSHPSPDSRDVRGDTESGQPGLLESGEPLRNHHLEPLKDPSPRDALEPPAPSAGKTRKAGERREGDADGHDPPSAALPVDLERERSRRYATAKPSSDLLNSKPSRIARGKA